MSAKTTPMLPKCAPAPAWVTVPMLAVALMKSGPSLLIRAYRKHEQLSSEAQPNVGKLFRFAAVFPTGRLSAGRGVCRQTDRRRAKADVRFGSLVDIKARSRHVRFTPDNGHSSVRVGCPKSAKSRHN